MNNRQKVLGFKQSIRLEWMARAADLAQAGLSIEDARRVLNEYLADRRSTGAREQRGKSTRTMAASMLMKCWVSVPRELESLHDSALRLLGVIPREEHVVIHWGAISAAYPLWYLVAMQTGRLLRLQGTVSLSQITHRMKEQLGDRQTVSRNTRYIVRSLVAWGALVESSSRGIYEQGPPVAAGEPEVMAWLAEAVLLTTDNGAMAYKALLDTPGLFPFQLAGVSAERLVAASSQLEVIRHGLDEDLIVLCSGGDQNLG